MQCIGINNLFFNDFIILAAAKVTHLERFSSMSQWLICVSEITIIIREDHFCIGSFIRFMGWDSR